MTKQNWSDLLKIARHLSYIPPILIIGIGGVDYVDSLSRYNGICTVDADCLYILQRSCSFLEYAFYRSLEPIALLLSTSLIIFVLSLFAGVVANLLFDSLAPKALKLSAYLWTPKKDYSLTMRLLIRLLIVALNVVVVDAILFW